MKQSELISIVNDIIDTERERALAELLVKLENSSSGEERLEEAITYSCTQIPAISARVAVSILHQIGVLNVDEG